MDSLKVLFKRIKPLSQINACIKCWQTKRVYRATVARYGDMALHPSTASVIKTGWATPKPCKRIFFLGTDEQQDKSGFVQALRRIGDVRVFTRDDGGWGQNDPSPYKERRIRNSQRLESLLSEFAREGWVPDVLIAQTWGCLIEPELFSRIRKIYGTCVINVAMDDRHQYWGRKVNGEWDGTYPLIPHIDLTLTAAPEAVDWYRKEGGAALFFPEASDPNIFHPMPELPKIHDVCFVGARYGIREVIVNALRAAGIKVTAYGNGWEAGRISTEEMPQLFAQSRIVLGVSAIGHCSDFVALKLRDFDAPMSGSCYLTQHSHDLESLYAIGAEIVTYQTPEDCVTQAIRLLGDEADREDIARAGRNKALTEHSWDRRFKALFARLDAKELSVNSDRIIVVSAPNGIPVQ